MHVAAAVAREMRRRRLVPSRPALGLAARRGWRAWEEPQERERALHEMAPLATDPHERAELGRRFLVEEAVREDLIGRPWALDRAPIAGGEHLREAIAAARGVLVPWCHWGPFPHVGRTLMRFTGEVHSVAGAWLFEAPGGDAGSLRAERWRHGLAAAGVSLVPAEGAVPAVVELLRRGKVVTVAFDIGGSVETNLLGLEATLSSGPARMAHAAGAMVAPFGRVRRRARAVTTIAEPLDAREHGDWETLHHAIARVHDEWMRRDPAAHERPRRLLPGYAAAAQGSAPSSR